MPYPVPTEVTVPVPFVAIIAPSESSPFCLYDFVASTFVSALIEPVDVIVVKDIPVPADTLVIVPSFFAFLHAFPVQTYNDESDIWYLNAPVSVGVFSLFGRYRMESTLKLPRATTVVLGAPMYWVWDDANAEINTNRIATIFFML
jgi:hypothetical protein